MSVLSQFLSYGRTSSVTYADRASLRSKTPTDGDQALIGNLGLFAWRAGSVVTDDDITCFATTSGRWLLEAPGKNNIKTINMESILGSGNISSASGTAFSAF